jgi:malonyl-CoA/methylmalonyl-CoA synthetase
VDELKVWCRDRLANYKAPDRLRIVAELPTNAMAKVIKPAVTELFT